jgi:hypothetical protein
MQHGLRADSRNSCVGFRRANPWVLGQTKFVNRKDLWRTNDDRRGCASRFDIFYAPYLTNADLGTDDDLGPDGNPKGPAFVAGDGTPHALIIVPLGAHAGSSHPVADKPSGGP